MYNRHSRKISLPAIITKERFRFLNLRKKLEIKFIRSRIFVTAVTLFDYMVIYNFDKNPILNCKGHNKFKNTLYSKLENKNF